MSKKKTNEEFISQVKQKHGDTVTLLTEYQGANKKILVRYNDCGHEDWKNPNKLLAGQLCSECRFKRLSKSKTKTKEQFVQDLKNRGYDFEILSDYNGVDQNVTVKNPKCGHIYEASPKNLISKGSGCPICHGIKGDTSFRKLIDEKYPGEYEILEPYKNGLTKILVRHKCGHEWRVIPKTLVRNFRCPKCNKSKNEWYVEKYLTERNFYFKREIWFRECSDELPLPFDFYIIYNGKVHLIEVDGEHHFNKDSFCAINYFEKIKKHEKIKNVFCSKYNIPLLRIPYTLFNDLSQVDAELDSFFNI